MNDQSDMFGVPSLRPDTIANARRELFAAAQQPKGTVCPCCDKFTKVYHRKFNSGMALSLIYAYRFHNETAGRFVEFQHVCMERYGRFPGDYSKLEWWKMLEKKDAPPEGGAKSAGLWRITEKGHRFVRDEISVASHALEYRGIPLRFDGDEIRIADALGKKFNYPELMREGAL